MSRHSPTGLEWLAAVVANPPADRCAEYPYGRFKNGGYGQVSVNNTPQRANRVAYEMAHGPIPDGLLVRHTCDNPPCCNPLHLVSGTQADNLADKVERGRQLRKLTADQIAEVRRRRHAGEMGTTIAREFGITPQAVYYFARTAA